MPRVSPQLSSLRLGLDEPPVPGGIADLYLVTGVTRVDARPPPGRSFGEELLAIGTALALGDPRCDVVGIMSRVSKVIQRELLEGLIPDLKVIQLVGELPLTVTARTRDGRHVVGAVRKFVVGHKGVTASSYMKAVPSAPLRVRSGARW